MASLRDWIGKNVRIELALPGSHRTHGFVGTLLEVTTDLVLVEGGEFIGEKRQRWFNVTSDCFIGIELKEQ